MTNSSVHQRTSSLPNQGVVIVNRQPIMASFVFSRNDEQFQFRNASFASKIKMEY